MKFSSMTVGLVLILSQTVKAELPLSQITTNNHFILPVDTHCQLSVNTPVIDYGSQTRWQLQDLGNRKVSPGKRTLLLNVACPFTQKMHFTLRGNKALNGDLLYGKQGSISLRLSDMQLDGKSIQVASTTDGSFNGSAESSLALRPDDSFAAITNGYFAKGKHFSAHIELEPILPEDMSRVSLRETNESYFTLELNE